MLSREEVQEKIDLTPKQEKAFNAFILAVKRCRKEKVYFYQVLDLVGALNGHNVIDIEDLISKPDGYGDPTDTSYLSFPTVRFVDAWADDTHFVKLK